MVADATNLPRPKAAPALRIALAGNPNSGKTSIFNALTGAHQEVGNYAGVTVEKKTGSFIAAGERVEVHDLPGTYSLTAYSPEERIAQEELTAGTHDVVVVVADSTNLKRNLVLLAQVIQTGANPVLCLNMADEARAAGQRLDVAQMERLLGFPVVETIGHRKGGVHLLRAAIARAAAAPVSGHRLVLGERAERAIAAISARLDAAAQSARTRDWVATRLLLNDPLGASEVAAHSPGAIAEAERQRRAIESETGVEIALFLTERYFGFVDGLLREVVTAAARPDARALSDRIDAVVAHRVLGLPIFAAIMYLVFWLTFTLGEIPMGWLEAGFGALAAAVGGLWPAGSDSALRSLLVDGIIGGVGGVVVFLPNIVLLFAGLAFLEGTGYMARAAFLMDRAMHRFGLHGQSFIPMMTGFGCSVPGIMATRVLANERDRLTTMLVLPLISCGARLPIWMLLIPAFFPPVWRAPMLWLVYAVGIALALVLALVLRRSLLKGDDAPFVMELPPYRLPTLKGVALQMGQRAGIYLRKAGTVILAVSILMWVVSAYPKAESYAVDAELAAAAPGTAALAPAQVERRRAAEDLAASVAGRLGRAAEPLFAPLGFDWRIVTAMLGAFAAKEVFVAQLGIVYSLGEASDEGGAEQLRAALGRDYSPLTGVSLMLFMLIATPCMATVAVTRRESGKWRWAALQFVGLTAVAYLVALAVYQIGGLFS